MLLYHCTTEAYLPGAPVGPHGRSHFTDEQHRKGFGWVESLLEQHRTAGQPCERENAVYASDSAANAAIFLEGQYWLKESKPSFHCYEVEVGTVSKAPMALVGLMQLAESDHEKAKMIAIEYWEPVTKWKYWEYFAPMMTVIRDVKWPTALEAAKSDYGFDQALGKRLWDLGSFLKAASSP
jgi:hypothetical protein